MGMSFGQFAGVSFDQLVETMVDLAVNGTHGRFVEDVMPRREPARLAPLEIHRPSESVRPVRRGQPLDVDLVERHVVGTQAAQMTDAGLADDLTPAPSERLPSGNSRKKRCRGPPDHVAAAAIHNESWLPLAKQRIAKPIIISMHRIDKP